MPFQFFVSPPPNLVAAIQSVFNADTRSTLFTGGLWDYVGRRPALPYATVYATAMPDEVTTEDGFLRNYLVQFSAFATTDIQAETLGTVLGSIFTTKKGTPPLVWVNGYEMTRLPGNTRLIAPRDLSPGSQPVWQKYLEFTWVTGGSF